MVALASRYKLPEKTLLLTVIGRSNDFTGKVTKMMQNERIYGES